MHYHCIRSDLKIKQTSFKCSCLRTWIAAWNVKSSYWHGRMIVPNCRQSILGTSTTEKQVMLRHIPEVVCHSHRSEKLETSKYQVVCVCVCVCVCVHITRASLWHIKTKTTKRYYEHRQHQHHCHQKHFYSYFWTVTGSNRGTSRYTKSSHCI